MSNLLIIRPLPIVAALQLAVAMPNLLTPDPKEVVNHVGGTATYYLDFGSAVSLDSFFLAYPSPISAGGYISAVRSVTAMNETGAAARAGMAGAGANLAVMGRRRSHLFRLAAPFASRYWAVDVTAPTAAAMTFGILAGGLAIQPAWGHEWGSGRQPIDLSSVAALRGGGFGIERGARMAAWRFTCGDLTDAEIQTLYSMVEEIGGSAPVVVCEDPDYTSGLNERLHYGLLDSPEAYEREIPGASRWSFRIREWV